MQSEFRTAPKTIRRSGNAGSKEDREVASGRGGRQKASPSVRDRRPEVSDESDASGGRVVPSYRTWLSEQGRAEERSTGVKPVLAEQNEYGTAKAAATSTGAPEQDKTRVKIAARQITKGIAQRMSDDKLVSALARRHESAAAEQIPESLTLMLASLRAGKQARIKDPGFNGDGFGSLRDIERHEQSIRGKISSLTRSIIRGDASKAKDAKPPSEDRTAHEQAEAGRVVPRSVRLQAAKEQRRAAAGEIEIDRLVSLAQLKERANARAAHGLVNARSEVRGRMPTEAERSKWCAGYRVKVKRSGLGVTEEVWHGTLVSTIEYSNNSAAAPWQRKMRIYPDEDAKFVSPPVDRIHPSRIAANRVYVNVMLAHIWPSDKPQDAAVAAAAEASKEHGGKPFTPVSAANNRTHAEPDLQTGVPEEEKGTVLVRSSVDELDLFLNYVHVHWDLPAPFALKVVEQISDTFGTDELLKILRSGEDVHIRSIVDGAIAHVNEPVARKLTVRGGHTPMLNGRGRLAGIASQADTQTAAARVSVADQLSAAVTGRAALVLDNAYGTGGNAQAVISEAIRFVASQGTIQGAALPALPEQEPRDVSAGDGTSGGALASAAATKTAELLSECYARIDKLINEACAIRNAVAAAMRVHEECAAADLLPPLVLPERAAGAAPAGPGTVVPDLVDGQPEVSPAADSLAPGELAPPDEATAPAGQIGPAVASGDCTLVPAVASDAPTHCTGDEHMGDQPTSVPPDDDQMSASAASSASNSPSKLRREGLLAAAIDCFTGGAVTPGKPPACAGNEGNTVSTPTG